MGSSKRCKGFAKALTISRCRCAFKIRRGNAGCPLWIDMTRSPTGSRTAALGITPPLPRVLAEARSSSDFPSLTEREFLVAAFGDLVGRPPEMRAIAIVAQNAAH